MGNALIIMLSYNELKKHNETKTFFFKDDREVEETEPFLLSKYIKPKQL